MSIHSRTIGILQPVYLPWMGYFEQLARVDHFVFLDEVRYTHRDWRNRNRIKTANGPIWLTVPIRRRPTGTLLREIEIDGNPRWQQRHLSTIEQSYKRCSHFEPLYSELVTELQSATSLLVDLTSRLIRVLCRFLDIDTPTSWSSTVPRIQQDRQDRLIEICHAHEATRFYEGARGAAYIDVERFRRAGIEVVFQRYRHPSYRQLHGDFLSHLSVVDLIMNTGPDAPEILRSSPGPETIPHGG